MTSQPADRTIHASRVVPVRRETVYAAWTDPTRLGEWFGPDGFSTAVPVMDLRPGGLWQYDMKSPDGQVFENAVVFTEVVPNEVIAYHHGDDTGQGHIFDVQVKFEDNAKGTRIEFQMVFEDVDEFERSVRLGAVDGAEQTLSRFANFAISAAK